MDNLTKTPVEPKMEEKKPIELSAEEIDQVGGAGTNWESVGTTIGLIGVSIAATPAMPIVAGVAAAGAAGTGIYSAWSSW